MGSGRTNLLLRHDKIREGGGRKSWLGRSHVHSRKHTKMMDMIGRVFHSAFLSSPFSFFLSLFFSRSL